MGPVILLPEDETRRKQLKAKLAEYELREKDDFRHPTLRMIEVCKLAALKKLLQEGVIDTHKLSWELVSQYGDAFSVDSFNIACGVIDDYCLTGGQNVTSGTGLPIITET